MHKKRLLAGLHPNPLGVLTGHMRMRSQCYRGRVGNGNQQRIVSLSSLNRTIHVDVTSDAGIAGFQLVRVRPSQRYEFESRSSL